MTPFALAVAVFLLAATFIVGGKFKLGVEKHRRRWFSLGAGIAAAYAVLLLLIL